MIPDNTDRFSSAGTRLQFGTALGAVSTLHSVRARCTAHADFGRAVFISWA